MDIIFVCQAGEPVRKVKLPSGARRRSLGSLFTPLAPPLSPPLPKSLPPLPHPSLPPIPPPPPPPGAPCPADKGGCRRMPAPQVAATHTGYAIRYLVNGRVGLTSRPWAAAELPLRRSDFLDEVLLALRCDGAVWEGVSGESLRSGWGASSSGNDSVMIIGVLIDQMKPPRSAIG
eukprot:gene817-biopygen18180